MEIATHFLASYLPPVGNPNTFNRFRCEIERFTLWLTIKHRKHPLELVDDDILDYLRFLGDPDRRWVAAHNTTRVIQAGKEASVNSGWRPFWAKTPKGISAPKYDSTKSKAQNTQIRADYDAELISNYSAKTTTLEAALRALGPFYKCLIEAQTKEYRLSNPINSELLLLGDKKLITNPVSRAKKWFKQQHGGDCTAAPLGLTHRLTERQWRFTLEAANELRLYNPHRWTRAWFLIAFLKANFLRVSDLCRSPFGTPRMSDITYVSEQDHWVFSFRRGNHFAGKTILPDDFLKYLRIYRESRGLSPALPTPQDHTPILSKIGPRKKTLSDPDTQRESSIAVATACEDTQAVFQYAQSYIRRQQEKVSESLSDDIAVLKRASSYWLFHTGVSVMLKSGTLLSITQAGLSQIHPETSQIQYITTDFASRVKAAHRRKV